MVSLFAGMVMFSLIVVMLDRRRPYSIVGVCVCYLAELLSLLGSGLVGVADEDLEDITANRLSEDGEEFGGRESRVSLYEFSNPLVQVWVGQCAVQF